jgi:hypothetical protein
METGGKGGLMEESKFCVYSTICLCDNGPCYLQKHVKQDPEILKAYYESIEMDTIWKPQGGLRND